MMKLPAPGGKRRTILMISFVICLFDESSYNARRRIIQYLLKRSFISEGSSSPCSSKSPVRVSKLLAMLELGAFL